MAAAVAADATVAAAVVAAVATAAVEGQFIHSDIHYRTCY